MTVSYEEMCKSLIATISANVDNEDLTDKAFRQFIRSSLKTVNYSRQSARTKAVSRLETPLPIHHGKTNEHAT